MCLIKVCKKIDFNLHLSGTGGSITRVGLIGGSMTRVGLIGGSMTRVGLIGAILNEKVSINRSLSM